MSFIPRIPLRGNQALMLRTGRCLPSPDYKSGVWAVLVPQFPCLEGSMGKPAAKKKPLLSNTCSRARLPGSERSLYSVEKFQGSDSSALISTYATGWDESHLRPAWLGFCMLCREPGSGTDVQMLPCKFCCLPPAQRTEPWWTGSPLLLTLAYPASLWNSSVVTKGKRQVWIYPPGGQGCVIPPLMLPMSQDAGLGGTPVYPAAYSPESCEQQWDSCY